MPTRGWHLVTYDIRDPVRLRQVAKLLEGYGERVQYSVFRCRLTPRQREELRWKLAQVVIEEDAWMMVPICAQCAARVASQDRQGRTWHEPPPTYKVL